MKSKLFNPPRPCISKTHFWKLLILPNFPQALSCFLVRMSHWIVKVFQLLLWEDFIFLNLEAVCFGGCSHEMSGKLMLLLVLLFFLIVVIVLIPECQEGVLLTLWDNLGTLFGHSGARGRLGPGTLF